AAYINYFNRKYESSFKSFNHIVDKYQNTSRIPDAKFYLALHYKDENYVEKNDNKASYLFEQVAQSDSKYKDNAKYMLAKFYETGRGSAKKNYKKAFDIYFELSKSKSHLYADAKNCLARYYFNGYS